MNLTKIAVYGTLLQGERNACWAPQGVQRCEVTIPGTLYDTGYGYPAFVPKGNTQVKAEILEVNEEELASMDILEGYPKLYRRGENQGGL